MRANLRIGDRLQNAAAPLLALVYPWLVALGPGVSRPLLALSLIVPAAAFLFAHARIDPQRYPAARRIALFAVGAPALFSFLGGWLDGQSFLPFKGLGAWCLIWTPLTAVAWFAPRHDADAFVPIAAPKWVAALRTAHGISAACIALFALFHIANHLAGLAGGAAHWKTMQALRLGYRSFWVETALLACVGFQVLSGTVLVWRASAVRTGLIASLQLASGAYLQCFFASHISAVFRTRYLRDTDTNWDWLVSSPLLSDAWSARLIPYYWLGVIALGIHAAAGLRYVLLAHAVPERKADAMFAAVATGAVLASSLIMTGLIAASESGAAAVALR